MHGAIETNGLNGGPGVKERGPTTSGAGTWRPFTETTNTGAATMTDTKLQQALTQANGRRRTRLIDLDDIVSTAQSLKPGEHRFIHGGHVANAYGYSAVATGAVVWIPSGKRAALAIVKPVDARRGCTGFGHESNWVAPIDYSDAIRITPEDKRIANAD